MARPRKTILDKVAEDTGIALELPSEPSVQKEQSEFAEGGYTSPEAPIHLGFDEGREIVAPLEDAGSPTEQSESLTEPEPAIEPKVGHDLTESVVLELDDTPTVTLVEPVKTIEELASERNPSGVVTESMDLETKEAVLNDRLRSILCKQKPRGAVPTLVRYHMGGQVPWRSVIIDIPEADLKEGWDLYRTVMPADGERYLLKVYELTRMDIPRLFRTVVELRLE